MKLIQEKLVLRRRSMANLILENSPRKHQRENNLIVSENLLRMLQILRIRNLYR